MRVALLFGGESAEHEISVQSARTIQEGLDPRRYQVTGVRIGRDGRWLLAGGPAPARLGAPKADRALAPSGPGAARALLSGVDVVFPALHGPMGEDGTVQGLLELAHLPYVGCGVLASSVGMDKEVAKRLAAQAGVPVLPHVLLRSISEMGSRRAAILKLGLPVFVKPSRLGSSVGIRKVKTPGALGAAVRSAFRYDGKVLIEKGVEAQEICVAVLGEPGAVEVSVCGEVEITGKHEFFDYEAKYFDAAGHALHIPARLPPALAEELRELAGRVFQAFEGEGLARVDFFVDRKTGLPYFGEINTLPGFTGHSLYPKLWEATGLSMPRLLDRLIALALSRHRRRGGMRRAPR